MSRAPTGFQHRLFQYLHHLHSFQLTRFYTVVVDLALMNHHMPSCNDEDLIVFIDFMAAMDLPKNIMAFGELHTFFVTHLQSRPPHPQHHHSHLPPSSVADAQASHAAFFTILRSQGPRETIHAKKLCEAPMMIIFR
jgi:transposase-like protein